MKKIKIRVCDKCGGFGYLTSYDDYEEICDECEGKGEIIENI